MNTDNIIKLGVEEALMDEQFQRKSRTWYRDLEETILVVDVQKSSFGPQYYINLGVMVKGIPTNYDSKLPPKENQCHIRVRLDALLGPSEEEQMNRILNLEDKSIGAAERRQGIKEIIKRVALPFLSQCSTREGIRSAESQGQLSSALVHRSIRDSVLS